MLIDTAGRSDPAALEAQAHLLKAAPEAEQHLVLSAATGGRELRAAIRRFKSRGVARFILTKLDEADGPASVLSVTTEMACPVSCVTNGQTGAGRLASRHLAAAGRTGRWAKETSHGPSRQPSPAHCR